jgi:hypothetical protein
MGNVGTWKRLPALPRMPGTERRFEAASPMLELVPDMSLTRTMRHSDPGKLMSMSTHPAPRLTWMTPDTSCKACTMHNTPVAGSPTYQQDWTDKIK